MIVVKGLQTGEVIVRVSVDEEGYEKDAILAEQRL